MQNQYKNNMVTTVAAPLFIYPLDLKKIYTHLTSDSGCYKKYHDIKVSQGITRQYLTVTEFCKAEDLVKDEVITLLVQ
jgi:hypothetical protein